jgi:hypothetical protein
LGINELTSFRETAGSTEGDETAGFSADWHEDKTPAKANNVKKTMIKDILRILSSQSIIRRPKKSITRGKCIKPDLILLPGAALNILMINTGHTGDPGYEYIGDQSRRGEKWDEYRETGL